MKTRLAHASPMGYLLGALVFLVVSDGLVSHFLVRRGLGYEGNPLLQTWVGEETFLIVKALGVLLCAFILWDMYKRWSRLALISTVCLVVVHVGIVLWNLSIFLTGRA